MGGSRGGGWRGSPARRATGAVAVALLVVLAACSGSGGSASDDGSVAAEGWLFVLRAESATFTPDGERFDLRLQGIDGTVVGFTDRPNRRAGVESPADFAARWDERFGDDPPEAALIAGGGEALVVTIEAFELSGSSGSLDVDVVAEVESDAIDVLVDRPHDLATVGALRDVALFVDGADTGPAGPGGGGGGGGGPGDGGGSSTPHLDAVEAALEVDNPTSRGIAWSRSSGNLLGELGQPDDAWLLQTPRCWGLDTCDTSSFTRFTGALRDITSGAEHLVDITTLFPFPDGEFRQALVDGLGASFAAGHRPLVRVIGGVSPGGSSGGASPSEWRDALVGDIAAAAGIASDQVPVAVASVATSWGWSWNHAKIVAVDGAAAVIGGHNLWTADYLQTTNPINDVSILHRGPLVADAHAFVDAEWGFVCANLTSSTNVDYQPSAAVAGCPAVQPLLGAPQAVGGVEALSVGRLGMGIAIPAVQAGPTPQDLASRADASAVACSILTDDYTNRDAPYERDNPGEPALRALIASATTSVTITQQDLIGMCSVKIVPKWDVRVFDALADRIAAGVEVRIVTSSPGTHDYSNGGTLADISSYLLSRVQQEVGGDATKAKQLFCAQVGVAPLRFNDTADAWPGGQLIGNHTKVVAVDRQAFYVGSQNLYPAWLQEYGVIVEDPTAAETFYGELLDPMWQHSERAKDTSQCPPTA